MGDDKKAGDALKRIRDGALKDSGKRIRKALANNNLSSLSVFDNAVATIAFGDMLNREVGRVLNRIETQAVIEEELAAQPEVKALPPSPPTPESEAFTERFWDDVGDATESEVRRLYAQAAVREIKQPNSISINTLSVLRRLDSKTVLAFEAISRFRCNKRVVVLPARDTPELTAGYAKHEITGSTINHLQSVGLFTAALPWKVDTYVDGGITYAFWRLGPKAVRAPVSLRSPGLAPPGVSPDALSAMFADGLHASSAALEIWSAVRPIPPIDEIAVGKSILRHFSGFRAQSLGATEESLDEGKTWEPHPGVWPL